MIQKESEREEIEVFLSEFIESQRLEMEYEIVNGQGEMPFDLMRGSSSDASMVLIGLRQPEPEEPEEAYVTYYRRVVASTQGMPVVMVLSAEKIDFTEIIGMG